VGAVDYEYNIGEYEVTNVQWRELLNAKANLGDPHGLYYPAMAGKYGGISGIGSGTADEPYVYTVKVGDANWARYRPRLQIRSYRV
jgi:formylglycine-generating enzyme required for sulfatase activity